MAEYSKYFSVLFLLLSFLLGLVSGSIVEGITNGKPIVCIYVSDTFPYSP